jgi:regulator of protease activity HflC (stomatin/prohibitin superfamily)
LTRRYAACGAILDEATDPWDIKVNRVELKNILPPREIQDAMEKQMKAEARKETSIREAEGEAEAILKVQQATAEGKATKIIIPSQIQGLAGLATTLA